jgi:tetratricopeptide (TPR) repeat protein
VESGSAVGACWRLIILGVCRAGFQPVNICFQKLYNSTTQKGLAMKNRSFIVLSSILLLISACSSQVTQSAPSATVAAALIQTTTQTSEPIPSLTIEPTSTEFLSTPTLDVAKIFTFTPAPYSECPTANEELRFPKPGKIKDPFTESEEIKRNITDFLNNGGTLKAIYDGLHKFAPDAKIFTADITNDKAPDLILKMGLSLFVFKCNHGKYETAFERTLRGDEQPTGFEFMYIKDINLNSVPEIIVKANALAMNFDTAFNCFAYFIYEWDGNQFKDLISPEAVNFDDRLEIRRNNSNAYSSNGIFSCGTFVNVDEVTKNKFEIKDTNQDGLAEITIVGGVDVPQPNWGDIRTSPEKQAILTLSWNGQYYVPAKIEYKSVYRIHAAMDGDTAFRNGDYEQAMKFYQSAIDNPKLIDQPLPPKFDTEQPDYITGRKHVIAYSYYRSLLARAAQSQTTEASGIYEKFQKKFSSDESTKSFAEMAAEFWNEYQKSNDLTNSCKKVNNYIMTHKEILQLFDLLDKNIYTAEDICPIQ